MAVHVVISNKHVMDYTTVLFPTQIKVETKKEIRLAT